MTFCYKRLWKLLIDKDMKKKDLCERAKVSTATLAKMNRGECVNTDVILRICVALDCETADIMEIVDADNKEG